ncbi:MAG: decaprenyl-phosphate phosphoribosyltransferase [Bacteroidota bacterium]
MNKKIVGAFLLLRPTQWAKNVFLFAPLIFSKHLFETAYLWREVLAFAGFCLVSSIVYVINDIADREADKLHPIKRNRPFASGLLRLSDVVVVVLILLAVVVSLTPYLSLRFWYTIALYGFLNLTYSFWLKQVVIVDVFIIAAGFMLRVLAGVFAIEVVISSWLILCTLFVSVFLAVSKRRGELMLSTATDSYASRPVLKQYDVAFLDQIMTVAASGMAISYALYTVAERTVIIFGTENLIFTTVFVLFGIFRYIFLMRGRKTDDNPMHLLLSDVPLVVNILLWFLACVFVIYFHDTTRWIF